ncbi:hypothetical protein OPIT5_03820 [Opitutaceae bacterium TAV5]|nr:hypothetical protein OPIT5_03820 [Opitutaceae bacterium TAV5]
MTQKTPGDKATDSEIPNPATDIDGMARALAHALKTEPVSDDLPPPDASREPARPQAD